MPSGHEKSCLTMFQSCEVVLICIATISIFRCATAQKQLFLIMLTLCSSARTLPCAKCTEAHPYSIPRISRYLRRSTISARVLTDICSQRANSFQSWKPVPRYILIPLSAEETLSSVLSLTRRGQSRLRHGAASTSCWRMNCVATFPAASAA